MAGGASGTRVAAWWRSTSCTVSTSTPNRCPSSVKVVNCCPDCRAADVVVAGADTLQTPISS